MAKSSARRLASKPAAEQDGAEALQRPSRALDLGLEYRAFPDAQREAGDVFGVERVIDLARALGASQRISDRLTPVIGRRRDPSAEAIVGGCDPPDALVFGQSRHMGSNANRLSGYGPSRSARSPRSSLSARRTHNPSTVRNCGWIGFSVAVKMWAPWCWMVPQRWLSGA